MNTIKITIRNYELIYPTILIDGVAIKFKRDKQSKCYIGTFQTEKNSVTLHIFKWYELADKNWKLKSFLNWLISLGGLLSAGYEKSCQTFDTTTTLNLNDNDNNLDLSFNSPRQNADAFKMFSNGDPVDIVDNKYHVDNIVKKRRKQTRIFSTIGFIVAAVLVAILIIILSL
ncbi:MAG: hypothetical protein RR348_01845 [Clostridia bacterium]